MAQKEKVEKFKKYTRHPFNWLPDMTPEEMELLKNSIRNNGFDHTQPIPLYEGKVLDGWQRYQAAMAIIAEFKLAGKNYDHIIPSYDDLTASLNDDTAIELVKRMQIRRNQPADVVVANFIKCDAMMGKLQKQVEEDKARKISEARKASKTENEINANLHESNSAENEANTLNGVIAAELGVKKGQVTKIKKLQKENPEDFEKVVEGKTTREIKAEAKAEAKETLSPEAPVKVLTNKEVLHLVLLARNKVQKLKPEIVKTFTTGDNEILQRQLASNGIVFQKIDDIQKELGKKLTEN